MDDAALKAIRSQIDQELASKDKHIGISFGLNLYKAFGQRGWFTREKFSVSETGAFPIHVIAYARSHNAVASWDLDDWAYEVGSRDSPES